MKIAQNPLKLIGCLREWPWLAASLFIAIAVGIYRPEMVGLLGWSLCKLCLGAGFGYRIDRSIARGPRPHELDGEAKDRALLRRAIIVASAILAMAMGP